MYIEADKIWDVFCSISNTIINEEAYGIIGMKGEIPKLSDFTARKRIVEIFNEYSYELINDGFLQFGIAYYDEQCLNEVFVSNYKYMNIWTNKKELLLKTLNNFKIKAIDHLNFIGEFPVVSAALICEEGKGITHYTKVIREIEKEFDKL